MNTRLIKAEKTFNMKVRQRVRPMLEEVAKEWSERDNRAYSLTDVVSDIIEHYVKSKRLQNSRMKSVVTAVPSTNQKNRTNVNKNNSFSLTDYEMKICVLLNEDVDYSPAKLARNNSMGVTREQISAALTKIRQKTGTKDIRDIRELLNIETIQIATN